MTTGNNTSCPDLGDAERRMVASRRQFLTGMLGAAGAMATIAATETVFAQAAFGGTPNGKVVVVLSQRGGADGLSLVVPHGDPHYYSARPNINVPKANVLGLDAMFGLHPNLKPLLPFWKNKTMALVHATGLPQPNRSHFEAMAEIEDAAPGTSIRTGWINRLMGLEANENPIDAVQLGSAAAPASLIGPKPTLSLPDLNSLGIPSWAVQNPQYYKLFRSAYHELWAGWKGWSGAGATAAFAVEDKLAATSAATYTPANGATYPNSTLGNVLKDTARLIKANLGTRVITIDHGSWDFHANLGNLQSGLLKDNAADFGAAVAAFVTDLGSVMSRVTLVTMTEFGRRVQENGDRGTDHGWGQAMFALGAGVNGGKVYGRWPGLAPANLANGDLRVTTDYRNVLAEVLQHRLDTAPGAVLPGFRPAALGMFSG